MNATQYVIYSRKHSGGDCHLWWRPESKGYTQDIRNAGRYSEMEALKIQRDGEDSLAISEDDLKRFSTFETVNMGWMSNAAVLKELLEEATTAPAP